MREAVERSLRWIAVGLGTLIIGSCTAAGGAAMGLPGFLAGIAAGAVAVALLFGWLCVYLMIRADICALRRAVAQLDQRQRKFESWRATAPGDRMSAKAPEQAPEATRTDVGRKALGVTLALAAIGATLAASQALEPFLGQPPALPTTLSVPAIDRCTNVDARVATLISQLMFGQKAHAMDPATRLKADLGADELDLVELQGALIDEFAIARDADLMDVETVGQLTDRIRRLNRCPGTSP